MSDHVINLTFIRPIIHSFIHSLDAISDFSRTIAPIIERVCDSNQETLLDTVYLLTHSLHIFQELPCPYGKYFCLADTGKDLVSACQGACVNNRTIEALNKTTDAFQILPRLNPEHLEYRIISRTDIQNETLSSLLDHYDAECREQFLDHVCTYDETITTLNAGWIEATPVELS